MTQLPSPVPRFLAAALLALGLLLPSLAAQAETRTAAWQADQEIDLEMGAFEATPALPDLLFARTERPDPARHLELHQPFKQQPPDAQEDFRPVGPVGSGRSCSLGPNKQLVCF